MPTVGLRPVEASDLDAIFEQMRDPVSVQMAAFTTEDPDDRVAFDVHMARVMALPDATLRQSPLTTAWSARSRVSSWKE